MFVGVMLVHLPLVLMKVEFVDARRAHLESLNVACLIFHNFLPRWQRKYLAFSGLPGRSFLGLRRAQLVTFNIGRKMFVVTPLRKFPGLLREYWLA
jgi:hypothetical protein